MEKKKPTWTKAQIELQNKYVGRAVTLNGEPAKIVRDEDGWGHVAPLNPNQGSIPWSWIGIYNICDNHGGKFPQ